MTPDKDTQTYANDSATSSPINTGLTQPRSGDVPAGVTYFIRVGDAIKIGSASNFNRRMHALQTAHEKPIEVLAVIPASLADEYKTHQLFSRLRIRGEWFRADEELLYFIEGLKMELANIPEPKADAAIRHLINARSAFGAKTPKGHACSNLVEQTKAIQTATGWQRANLVRSMAIQMNRLAAQ
jgi:hypothetical protein